MGALTAASVDINIGTWSNAAGTSTNPAILAAIVSPTDYVKTDLGNDGSTENILGIGMGSIPAGTIKSIAVRFNYVANNTSPNAPLHIFCAVLVDGDDITQQNPVPSVDVPINSSDSGSRTNAWQGSWASPSSILIAIDVQNQDQDGNVRINGLVASAVLATATGLQTVDLALSDLSLGF